MTDASPKSVHAGVRHRDAETLVRHRARAVGKCMARSVRAPRDQHGVFPRASCQRSGTMILQQAVLDRTWRGLIIEEHDRRLLGHPPSHQTVSQEDCPILQRRRRLTLELVAVKPLVGSGQAVALMPQDVGAPPWTGRALVQMEPAS